MDKGKLASITAVIGVLATLLALDWQNLLTAIGGLPGALAKWTGALPGEEWSAILGLFLSMGTWGFCYLHPRATCTQKPHSCADKFGLGIGILVVVLQQMVIPHTAAELLTALWIGGTMGLLGVFLARWIWSFFAPPKEPVP